MSIFKQFYFSIFSPVTISKFRYQKVGKTILYVFFLSLLALIPSFIYFTNGMVNGLHQIQEVLKTSAPSFSIEDGTLKTDHQEILVESRKDVTFILDPTNEMTESEYTYYKNALIFSENKLLIISNGQVQTVEYNLFNTMTITKDDMIPFMDSANRLLPIIIPTFFVILYVLSAGLKFFEITILALFGMMLNNSLNRQLKFKSLWTLAAYSATLATVFFTITEALKITIPFGAFINWFVLFIVLFLSIKEVPSKK